MKKFFYLFLLISIIFACNEEKKSFYSPEMVTINGVIENFSKEDSIEDVKVYSYDFLTNDWAEEHQAIVDENGHFSLQFLNAYKRIN